MKKLVSVGVALASFTACSGEGATTQGSVLVPECRSPRALSQLFQGQLLEKEVSIKLPESHSDVDGYVIGWKSLPDGEFHDSIPVNPSEKQVIVTVGEGAVQFSVQAIGLDIDASSDVCLIAPTAIYSPATQPDLDAGFRPEW